MSVKTFVESIVSQITVSGDTFAFAHGEKDFQNLFSDEAVYPIVYLDEPIQNDFQIVSSGAIQEYYPIQLMILYKTELDFTPDQHDVLIQKARLCARKFLTLAGMSQQVRELDSIKGIEVINVFDANTSGIVLSCRLSFYDSTSICADYDPVQGFVVLTNSNDSWSDQAQNNTTYIVPNTVFEILDQNGDNYGEYSVPSVNGGAVTISVAPCDLATYQNSDGSFIQTIASGDTFVSDDITVNVYDQNETLVASETVSSNINVDLTVNIPEIEVNADVLNTLGEIVATKLVTPTDNEITAPDGSVHLKKENDGSITTLSIPSGATENYVVQNNDITVNGANGFEIHATDPLDVRLRNESNQVVQPISVTHAGNHATIVLPTNEIDVTINGITVAEDAVSDVALTLVDQNSNQVPFTQTGNEIKVIPLWASFTTAPTTSVNWRVVTKNGGQYRVDWGDGTITTHNSFATATKTYSTPYSGVIKIGAVNGGIANVDGIRSTAGAWNFDISIIKNQIPDLTYEVHFSGNSMALTGNIASLPSGLNYALFFEGSLMTLTGNIASLPSGLTYQVVFIGNSMTLTGDISTLPTGLTYQVYFNGNLMTLTGNIASLPSGLTFTVFFVGSQMTLTGDISNLPSGLTNTVFLEGNLMTLTGDIRLSAINATRLSIVTTNASSNVTYTAGRVWRNMTVINIRLRATRLSATEVDNIFIDLNNSPLVTGAGTIDLRGNNAPPTAASLAARNSLVTKGKTILTN